MHATTGDLDMAEGWAGEDFGMSPTKKRKKKKLVGKAKEKAVTKKGTKAKHVLPTKKKLLKDGKKKAEDKSSTAKTKKKKKADVTPKKKQSASADESSVEEKFTPASSSKKTAKPVSKEKENVTQLRKLYKRKYNICIKLIKDLTPQQLPRKPRKSTIKLLVNIPPGKKVGDNITFQNPNVAGQKLKAAIPKDADMEKLTMVGEPGTERYFHCPTHFFFCHQDREDTDARQSNRKERQRLPEGIEGRAAQLLKRLRRLLSCRAGVQRSASPEQAQIVQGLVATVEDVR